MGISVTVLIKTKKPGIFGPGLSISVLSGSDDVAHHRRRDLGAGTCWVLVQQQAHSPQQLVMNLPI
jgi:hypothetical protein